MPLTLMSSAHMRLSKGSDSLNFSITSSAFRQVRLAKWNLASRCGMWSNPNQTHLRVGQEAQKATNQKIPLRGHLKELHESDRACAS